jgi:hypothetical protein
MFATVEFVSQGSHERILVPVASILRLHDKDWVFRAEAGGRFRRTEIQAGPVTGDGQQEVLGGGLQPGDAVVSNALEFSSAVEQM